MDARKLKDYHIWPSSNTKLFGAQRRETAKLLPFLELLKTTFNCGRNSSQQSASVGHNKRNSLDP
jgi:hypothetical protein